MKIGRLIYGVETPGNNANTYVVTNDDNEAIIIDPSAKNTRLLNFLKSNSLKPVAVLLTHGHYDHIKGIPLLLENYSIPVYIHYLDKSLLSNSVENVSEYSFEKVELDIDTIDVTDGEHLNLIKGIDIEVIHTPYHTAGSCCYYLEDNKTIFTGDSLFKNSIGRDDLPTSCPRFRTKSLEKLKKLPDDVIIYPGHGDISSIKHEKKTNNLFMY